MKNLMKKAIFALAALVTVTSCDMEDFGDINKSPNAPSEASTGALFIYAARYPRNFIFNSTYYDIWTQAWPGYLSEAKNNQYGPMNNTIDYGTGGYYTGCIKNLNEIIARNEDESEKSSVSVLSFGSNANQIAVAKTLRAYIFMTLSDIVGPIVMSEAMKGNSDDIWEPKYDSVEEVYAALDKELSEVWGQFDTSSNLTDDDILFGGDTKKWKKFNATLRMMMAIKLKDVAPSVGQARFAKAYADGGMTDASDSFTYQYDSKFAESPAFCQAQPTGYTGSLTWVPSKLLVDMLKEYNDPRLFTYCDITASAYKGQVGDGDRYNVDNYKGVPYGLESNSAVNTAAQGCASIGVKYTAQMFRYGIITAARCLLVEAEAAQLGWINASAEDLYVKGIKASFDFEKSTDSSWQFDLDAYLAQDKVKLSANKDEAIAQIVTQRWFAGYLTDGVEAWSDWRINNIPLIPVYQGQLDAGYETYPYRLQFGSTDKNTNTDNVNAAVQSAFGGNDDRWSRIWWDVKDNVSPVGKL